MKNDQRVKFANYCCKILFKSKDEDIHRAIFAVKELYDYFEANVRNNYECVEYIPLFKLYEIGQNSHDREYMDMWLEERNLTLAQYRKKLIDKAIEIYS